MQTRLIKVLALCGFVPMLCYAGHPILDPYAKLQYWWKDYVVKPPLYFIASSSTETDTVIVNYKLSSTIKAGYTWTYDYGDSGLVSKATYYVPQSSGSPFTLTYDLEYKNANSYTLYTSGICDESGFQHSVKWEYIYDSIQNQQLRSELCMITAGGNYGWFYTKYFKESVTHGGTKEILNYDATKRLVDFSQYLWEPGNSSSLDTLNSWILNNKYSIKYEGVTSYNDNQFLRKSNGIDDLITVYGQGRVVDSVVSISNAGDSTFTKAQKVYLKYNRFQSLDTAFFYQPDSINNWGLTERYQFLYNNDSSINSVIHVTNPWKTQMQVDTIKFRSALTQGIKELRTFYAAQYHVGEKIQLFSLDGKALWDGNFLSQTDLHSRIKNLQQRIVVIRSTSKASLSIAEK